MIATGTDPRRDAANGDDIRPIVASERRAVPGWMIAGGILLTAMMLFAVLEGGRQSRSAPTTRPLASERYRLPAAPPTLFIPPDARLIELPPRLLANPPAPILPSPLPVVPTPPAIRSIQPPPVSPPVAQSLPRPMSGAEPRTTSSGPVLVIDNTASSPDPAQRQSGNGFSGPVNDAALATGSTGNRVRAGQLGNPATTVPQGTLIAAVLETALDSTRPGQVRALVSRNVRGFDGSRVLIPRGSRLFGEYRADLRPGQKRAFVQWTRLVRPDGVSIAIGSPAADPLGRAGIRGKVDSHFFERFGSAILQSTLDIGVSVATQQLGGSNVVLIPGASQAFRPNVQLPIQPTLTVRQGARVTVFVANDLDFAGAGAGGPAR